LSEEMNKDSIGETPSEDQIADPNCVSEDEETTLSQETFEEALREKEQFRSIAQRAQADLVNYRQRASQELEESRRTVQFGILSRFLGVADDLSRAIDNLPDDADETWIEGISLVARNLSNSLEIEGVQKIEAIGEQFDPYQHEAIMYEERCDEEEGTIVSVIQDGYKLNDRILRPARVVVAQAKNLQEEQIDPEKQEDEQEEN